MNIDKVAIGKDAPHDVNVIIENPMNADPVKYEMDKESGFMFVDRVLHTPMRYPGNYGFIPHTLSDDGDPVDCIVVGTVPVIAGAILPSRPVGVLVMDDESGMDEKIIAVPAEGLNPYHDNIQNYSDLRPILLDQIKHFFEHYKDLEPGKWVKTIRWGDAAEARDLIKEGIERLNQEKAA